MKEKNKELVTILTIVVFFDIFLPALFTIGLENREDLRSLPEKPIPIEKPPHKIYEVENASVIAYKKERVYAIPFLDWRGTEGYRLLLSNGDEHWILVEWKSQVFFLQHQNTTVDIYRWSGSFLDLDRHFFIDFKENGTIISTYPIVWRR